MSSFNKTKNTMISPMDRLASGANVGRLYEHMMKGPFAAISAHRGANESPEERAQNNARTRDLKRKLRERGFGWVDTVGAWKDTSTGVGFAKEHSVFISGIGETDAAEIGRAFDQDAILVGDQGRATGMFLSDDKDGMPAHKRKPFLDGPVSGLFRSVAPADAPDIYTSVRNKRFQLDGGAENDDDLQPISDQNADASELKQITASAVPIITTALARSAVTSTDRVFYALNGHPPFGMAQMGVKNIARGWLPILSPNDDSELVAWVPFRYANMGGDDRKRGETAHSGVKQTVRNASNGASDEGDISPHASVRGPQETASLFLQKQGEDAPRVHNIPLTLSHDDYAKRIERGVLYSGTALGAARLLVEKPYGHMRQGLASIYIDRSGKTHVITPHQHTQAAFWALMENAKPPEEGGVWTPNRQSLPKSQVTFSDLTLASGGIMRAQFYPDGVGLSIHLETPPTDEQLNSIEDYYRTTSRQKFVAELYQGRSLIGHAKSPAQLHAFLQRAKELRSQGKDVRELAPVFAHSANIALYRDAMPSTVGGVIG